MLGACVPGIGRLADSSDDDMRDGTTGSRDTGADEDANVGVDATLVDAEATLDATQRVDGGVLGDLGTSLDSTALVDGSAFADAGASDAEPSHDAACTSGACVEATPAMPRARAYIGPDGVDHGDCTGGTRANPWRTWSGPRAAGCIQPGDAIYLMAGTYDADGDVFRDGGVGGHIFLDGAEGRITWLAADPEAPGPWPVKLRGTFVFYGAWGEIRGIEFESAGGNVGTGTGTVMLFAGHTTLRHNYIHTRAEDFSTAYNCLKLPPQEYADRARRTARSVGLRVLDNRMSCPATCIALNSIRDAVFRGNELYGCRLGMSVKSGAEEILIEANRVHDVRYGIAGYGSTCKATPCATSLFLAQLPIEERFGARQVAVRNNLLYAIGDFAFELRAWRDADIFHNTVVDVSRSAFRLGSISAEFTDDIAREHCGSNACAPCADMPTGCWKISVTAKNIAIENNIVSGAATQISADRDALEGLVGSHNIWFNASRALMFEIYGPTERFSLGTFPHESGSFDRDPGFEDPAGGDFSLRADAFARDKGLPLEVACDHGGRARCDAPDVGAWEFQLR